MDDPSPNHSPEGSSRVRYLEYAGLALVIPLLYLLSIGPAIKYLSGTPFTDTLEILYAPVIWLHENTLLKEPLEEYVKLWE
jgi:hypothetical protein